MEIWGLCIPAFSLPYCCGVIVPAHKGRKGSLPDCSQFRGFFLIKKKNHFCRGAKARLMCFAPIGERVCITTNLLENIAPAFGFKGKGVSNIEG